MEYKNYEDPLIATTEEPLLDEYASCSGYMLLIPDEIKIEHEGTRIALSSKLGRISLKIPEFTELLVRDQEIYCLATQGLVLHRPFVRNLERGVPTLLTGNTRRLLVRGVGYKGSYTDDQVILKIGYSNLRKISMLRRTKTIVARKTQLLVFSLSKAQVENFARMLQRLSRRDPYKGKGVRLVGEDVALKVGKRK